MKQTNILLCMILIISIFLCSCSSVENNKHDTSSSVQVTPTPTSTINLDIPNEQSLVQVYTNEIKKLTDYTVVSTTYENFINDTTNKKINVIAKMSDGKIINIYAVYYSELSNPEWTIISIKNVENSHIYYAPGDTKLCHDMYEYDFDKPIPKEHFLDKYKLKDVNFSMSSDWEKDADSNKYMFYNKSQKQISVLVEDAPYNSLDKTWRTISSTFTNYKLKEKCSIKLGGKKAKQWEFSYSSDGATTPYNAIMTMVIYKKHLYIFSLVSSFALSISESAYGVMLKSVSWKK